MKRIRNPYPGGTIMHLNMMGVQSRRKLALRGAEVLLACVPVVFLAIAALYLSMPSTEIWIECQNIPGGDICRLVTG